MHCLVAVLKYLSRKKELTDEETSFADYNITMLYDKSIIFPFYKDFYGKVSLPIHLMDEYYVEYIAEPGCEVKIHYLITSVNEAVKHDGKFITIRAATRWISFKALTVSGSFPM